MTRIKRRIAIMCLFSLCFLYFSPAFSLQTSASTSALNAGNIDTQGIIYTLDDKTGTAAVSDTTTTTISGTITIPDTVTKNSTTYTVASIEAFAFYNCISITDFSIPQTVTTIENAAFRNCASVSTFTIPNSVKIIAEETFYECDALRTITLPIGLTDICDSAFYKCESMTTITLPSTLETIGIDAFKYCKNLEAIQFPSSLQSIGGNAFYNCAKIASITIPDSVVCIGRSAFLNTAWYKNKPDGLIYINKIIYKYKGTMPANTTITLNDDTKIIADEAFSRCKTLVAIHLPESLTRIGSGALLNCTALSTIQIPASVTEIGNSAFFGCTNLTTIEIPTKVRELREYTFYDCTALRSVTIPASVLSISSTTFNNFPNLTFYLFSGSSAYRYALNNGIKYQVIGNVSIDWSVSYSEGFAIGIIEGQTLSNIAEKSGVALTAKDLSGNNVSGNTLVGTGFVISYQGANYTVIVKGDLNGDGNVDSKDYLSVKRTILGTLTLNDSQNKAACLGDTSVPNARDYLKIKRHFLGIYNIYN